MPSIRIDNLTLSYGKKDPIKAISSFSCLFPAGRLSVVLGPSGCGKTSLLRAIIGLEKYQGSIYFDEVDATTFSIQNRNVAYVNQNISLYPHLTLFENIAMPLKTTLASPDEIKARVFEEAKNLGIESCLSCQPRQVSWGQCQRAAIARALVKRPNLYLFDEPFTNLDEPRAVELRKTCHDLIKARGSTAIFVTHNLKEAIVMGDYFVVMEKGACLAEGNLKELRHHPNPSVSDLFTNDKHFL